MKKIILFFILLLSFSIVFSQSQISVSSRFGTLGDKQHVLKDNVVIKKSDLTMMTEVATITQLDDDWRDMVCSATTIKTSTLNASAEFFKFDLSTEKGQLSKKVSVKILVDKKDLYISCDVLEFNNKEKNYTGFSNDLVKILKEDYVISAKNFSYNEITKILVLNGDVRIKNDAKKIDLKTQNSTFRTDTNEMKAEGINLTLEVKENK
ncbi:MAG TPA: LptA/OstA family protein [Petrotogaceae bacterium]|jgi:lipopolysaccharide assembly outer membrane protein LptD (OstA)|nr:LptA/OstA family protein [Petrotogaceae bacterium]HQF32804.1 LptA/OstA family protein [Petrotogaceae bacterium]HQH32620.1 LptA/OstA family protein [Petrotogaceae bacterium]HQI78765.1 LptA/OstA family protein [Petrotogaceae bacterium]